MLRIHRASGGRGQDPRAEVGRVVTSGQERPSQNPKTSIAAVGLDVGKNSFHVVGLDQRGTIVLGKSGRVAR